MRIHITKTFGNLKKGQVVDRIEATAKKLIQLGHAVADNVKEAVSDVKELKADVTKEFKSRKQTK